MNVKVMECSDFSEFQETLKNMRKVDDIIVSTINTVISTASFNGDNSVACKELYYKLEDGNIKRETTIKNCINFTSERVRKLKEQREENNDPKLSKTLRAEQTKLRMLQMELSVEDLIKERTSKVFNEKCRTFYKPK